MINRKNIFLDIILTIFTAGLFNIWVQYRQIRDSNEIVPESERKSFLFVMLLSLITLGLYFIWHEVKMTWDLHHKVYGRSHLEIEILCGIGTLFGLWFLVDSYQQSLLNQYAKFTQDNIVTN